MPRLELDHLLVCVGPGAPQGDELRRLGFTVEFEREHPGQGTRNRLLLFAEHYLELLWVADRKEAREAMVRLDRRVDFATTGASPFGVALRGPKEAAPEVDWVRYRLPAFPNDLWIARPTLDDPALPLVFAFERPPDLAGGPRHGGYPPRLWRHECGATGIAAAVLAGPGLGAAPLLPLAHEVRLAEAEAPAMTLRLAGPTSVRARVGGLLALEPEATVPPP